ncbi:sensor histidine kinase [Shumkonia mesophila]|uniref:sensor histidine kinase n=1 Tax=Shumkonia mesophila TaxID=2838854 RepID=UPI002934B40C|nr:ATP-binding protein [Shumkonia mesophila]
MDAGIVFALGAAALGACVAPILVWQGRRLSRRRREAKAREADARIAWDVVAASPDGFLIWETASGAVRVSSRLAVLLNLAGGVESGYEEVLGRFADDDAARLAQAVEILRRDGTGFGMALPVVGRNRQVQVSGVRAFSTNGDVAADVLWIRDAGSPIPRAAAPAVADAEGLKTLCEALPFPVWLRGPDREIAFANPAASAQGADPESPPSLEITEVSLAAGRGTAAFALPADAGTEGRRVSEGWAKLLDVLPVGIAVFGPDARLEFHNATFARLWRLDDHALAGRPRLGQLLDLLREHRLLPEVPDYPAFREEQVALFRLVTQPEVSLMHLPDGRTVRRVCAPHPTGGLVFAYEDLSERLSLERSINELSAVQRETLDNLFEAVAVFGGDGRLKLNNPAFVHLWELDGKAIAQGIHLADFALRMNARLEESAGGSRPVVTAARLMKREPGGGRLARTDGAVIEYATVPLPDGAVLVSFLNVTDSAQVEAALRQRAEALDEANRLKSAFIANVSYEIRTPLTTLIGFAEILAEEYFGELNRRQKEYCQGILETSQNLMTVVSDTLDLASIEAGIMSLELDAVDVHGLLAGTLKLVRERSRFKSLKVEFDCPPDIGWIVADGRRLRQVFFNLMSNAVRFAPARGRVGLTARKANDEVVISISDTGPGMSEEQIRRAVQPFGHGTDPEVDGRGAGLGLSLVTRFVELHAGRVEIRSAPGRGTTVICRLPTGATQAGT